MLLIHRLQESLLLFDFTSRSSPCSASCWKPLLVGAQLEHDYVALTEHCGSVDVVAIKENVTVVQVTEDEPPLAIPVPASQAAD